MKDGFDWNHVGQMIKACIECVCLNAYESKYILFYGLNESDFFFIEFAHSYINDRRNFFRVAPEAKKFKSLLLEKMNEWVDEENTQPIGVSIIASLFTKSFFISLWKKIYEQLPSPMGTSITSIPAFNPPAAITEYIAPKRSKAKPA